MLIAKKSRGLIFIGGFKFYFWWVTTPNETGVYLQIPFIDRVRKAKDIKYDQANTRKLAGDERIHMKS